MRYARLFVPYRGYWDIQVDLNSIEGGYHGYQYNCIVVGSPYRGYWDIQVDLNSIEGGYHGYQYNCIVVGSGAEITCYRDEFEFVD